MLDIIQTPETENKTIYTPAMKAWILEMVLRTLHKRLKQLNYLNEFRDVPADEIAAVQSLFLTDADTIQRKMEELNHETTPEAKEMLDLLRLMPY